MKICRKTIGFIFVFMFHYYNIENNIFLDMSFNLISKAKQGYNYLSVAALMLSVHTMTFAATGRDNVLKRLYNAVLEGAPMVVSILTWVAAVVGAFFIFDAFMKMKDKGSNSQITWGQVLKTGAVGAAFLAFGYVLYLAQDSVAGDEKATLRKPSANAFSDN